MSRFFGGHRTVVFSQAQQLSVPDPVPAEDAVLYAVLKKQSIPETLLKAINGGLTHKIPSLLKYAQDTYTLGLPNHSQSSSNRVTDTALQDIITTDLSLTYGCLVKYQYVAPLTLASIILPYLVSTRAFSLNVNKIGTPPDDWVFPEEYGGRPTVVEISLDDLLLDDDQVSAHIKYKAHIFTSEYKYVGGETGGMDWVHTDVPTSQYEEYYIEDFTIASGFHLGQEYCVAGYRILDSESVADPIVNMWYYATSSNVYPALTISPVDEDENNAYPVVPLRYENVNISATNCPEIYNTGKVLLRRIGLNFDQLTDTLDESESSGDLDNAYVMFGVDLQTDDVLLLSYLGDFFHYLFANSQATIWDIMAQIAVTGKTTIGSNYHNFGRSPTIYVDPPITTDSDTHEIFGTLDTANSTIINPANSMSLTEHGLDTGISYSSISSYFVTGSIGDIGHATKEFDVKVSYESIEQGDSAPNKEMKVVDTILYLRKQVSASTYREVKIHDLIHTNNVYGDKRVITTIQDVSEDVDEHNFILPLHHTVIQQMGLDRKMPFYEKTLVLVLTGHDEVRIKWYETGAFSFIVAIISLVVIAYTGYNALTALQAMTTQQALLTFIYTNVVQPMAFSLIADLAIDTVGEDIGIIIAAMAAVYSIYKSGMGEEIITSLGTMNITAKHLLMAGVKLAGAAAQEVQEKTAALIAESEEFTEYAEAEWETLIDMQKELLIEPPYLTTFSYLDTTFGHVPPDTQTEPENFYDKIHDTNPGVLALDMIEHNVAISLYLEGTSPTYG